MTKPLKKRSTGRYEIHLCLPSARGKAYLEYVQNELEQPIATFTKELLFEFLKKVLSNEEYQQLKQADEADWEDAVMRRKESFKKTQEQKKNKPSDS